MSLDLNKLENNLDEALRNETSQSLNKWLNNKQKKSENSIWTICDAFYEENIDSSNIPREHYEFEIKQLMVDFANFFIEIQGGEKC